LPTGPKLDIVSVTPTNQQGNPVSSFSPGKMAFVKVSVSTDSNVGALVTINLFGPDQTSLGIGSIGGTIFPGQSDWVTSFFIPDGTISGEGIIYANVFTDWPSVGGTPLTPELSGTVTIGMSQGSTITPPTTPPDQPTTPPTTPPDQPTTPPDQPTTPPTTPPDQPTTPPDQPTTPPTTGPTTVDITIPSTSPSKECAQNNSCFSPDPVTINVGDTVTWTNQNAKSRFILSGTPTAATGEFDSGMLPNGGVFSHTFRSAGTFYYFEALAPWEQGRVIVR